MVDEDWVEKSGVRVAAGGRGVGWFRSLGLVLGVRVGVCVGWGLGGVG